MTKPHRKQIEYKRNKIAYKILQKKAENTLKEVTEKIL